MPAADETTVYPWLNDGARVTVLTDSVLLCGVLSLDVPKDVAVAEVCPVLNASVLIVATEEVGEATVCVDEDAGLGRSDSPK